MGGFRRGTNKKKKTKLPGQLENCEACEKRFTVTPYSKTGPGGGLLCTACGKKVAKEAGTQKTARASGGGARKRRKMESDKLDGKLGVGAKSLRELCIETVVRHHEDVEELGDLPEDLLERLSEIFTRRRVLRPDTLKLFMRSDLDSVVIHDCSYLEADDYRLIFSVAQKARRVALNNCCQFLNSTMGFMIDKAVELRDLKLYAANLVTDEYWCSFFRKRGAQLESLRLSWLDSSFADDTVAELARCCTSLKRLKLYRCRLLGEETLNAIARMTTLEHLSLHFSKPVSTAALVHAIVAIGPNLRTLSLIDFTDASDELLAAVHGSCRQLRKLRLRGNDVITDAAFAALFTDWPNPPLVHVDLGSTRDVDNANPLGPSDAPVGLADAGFRALLRHSAPELASLDVASCRHVSTRAWLEAFDGAARFPALRVLDASFCGGVDGAVVAAVFGACPRLERVVVFGCFGVEGVGVPRGVLLIGAPRAQEAIEVFGGARGGGGEGVVGMVEAVA